LRGEKWGLTTTRLHDPENVSKIQKTPQHSCMLQDWEVVLLGVADISLSPDHFTKMTTLLTTSKLANNCRVLSIPIRSNQPADFEGI
jgi:hypothetical protein